MKPTLLFTIALLTTSIAFGQGHGADDEHHRLQTKVVKTSSAPVTHVEAQAVFAKAWKALGTSLKLKGVNPVKFPADSKPVTKNEVLVAFNSFVALTRPTFKRSASKVSFVRTRVRKDMDLKTFGKLIEDGFVMPVGPLAAGKNGSLTTYEFGDAVGVMLIRIADLAHLPSRKFTPALMPP